MDYDGARIEIDLMKSVSLDYYLTISQKIDIETHKGKACANYPTKDFTSYRDCDEKFVYNPPQKSGPKGQRQKAGGPSGRIFEGGLKGYCKKKYIMEVKTVKTRKSTE